MTFPHELQKDWPLVAVLFGLGLFSTIPASVLLGWSGVAATLLINAASTLLAFAITVVISDRSN
jgi:hypothetical protein